jgi:DNA-binding transcriptional regulator PaaX
MKQRQGSLGQRPQSVAEWIIFLAVTGVVLTSPYGGRAVTSLIEAYLDERARAKKIRAKFEARNIFQALYRLKKKKIIQVKQQGNEVRILLTARGRLKKLAYDIEKMKIPKPKRWDRRWRFLVFDIPEEMRLARDALRDRLKQLGFIQFQQSIWIYPYPCEEEIEFVTEFLKVGRYTTLLTVKLDDDKALREAFSKLGL